VASDGVNCGCDKKMNARPVGRANGYVLKLPAGYGQRNRTEPDRGRIAAWWRRLCNANPHNGTLRSGNDIIRGDGRYDRDARDERVHASRLVPHG